MTTPKSEHIEVIFEAPAMNMPIQVNQAERIHRDYAARARRKQTKQFLLAREHKEDREAKDRLRAERLSKHQTRTKFNF